MGFWIGGVWFEAQSKLSLTAVSSVRQSSALIPSGSDTCDELF
jgi:hypothetical protein